MAVRLSGSIGQTLQALELVTAQPFVAGLAANAVPVAQLGGRPQIALMIADELHTLVHG
jgi:hypothetical protein